jgi:hypothetical protein
MRTGLTRLFPSAGTTVGLLLTAVVWQLVSLNPTPLQRLEAAAKQYGIYIQCTTEPDEKISSGARSTTSAWWANPSP